VRRGASDIHAVKYALEQLKQGEYVVLFPEGTRVTSREEGEPKTGAAMLACRTGVNVVPVYIPMHKRPFRINRVYIGKPYVMKPQGKRATSQDYEVFTAELMDKIYDLGDEK
jgi:1-acyl-sn-glycerol-3-phosphate acyltransferase